MFNSISKVLPRLRDYEYLFPNHERLIQAMSVVYHDVLEFCVDAKRVFRRGKRSVMKLVWKPFESQFGSRLQSFREHMDTTEKEVSTSHMLEAADSRALIRSNQMQVAKERYGRMPVDFDTVMLNFRQMPNVGKFSPPCRP